MRIFYIDTDEFLKNHDYEFLRQYSENREFKSEKRLIQYSVGRYIVKTVAKEIFKIPDTAIIVENEKPKFKSGGIYFSISHCENIVAAAFDTAECGLDIEKIKPRDFNALAERYNKKFTSAEDFYRFWTEYEAEIKLGKSITSKYSCIFLETFMLTAVSEKENINAEIALLTDCNEILK